MDQPNIPRNQFSPDGSSEPDSMRRNTASMAGGNGSSPQAATQDHDVPPKQRAQLRRRGASGPRTELGKRRASRNAIKHAIFSDVIILQGDRILPGEEQPSKHRALLEGLVAAIQPEGALEEILVEKLAALFWRYRRLLRAEKAEIVAASEAAQYSYIEGSLFEAFRTSRQDGMFYSAYRERSWQMLDMAVKSLKEMHEVIEKKGLDWNRDRATLKSVYGTTAEYEKDRRWDEKMHLTRVDPEPVGPLAKAYKEATLQPSRPAPDDSVAFVIKLTDGQIAMFEDLSSKWKNGELRKMVRAIDASVVPPPEVGERLQRYEAMLERAVDRTLGQIERLQRMRRGQPAPPEIKVNLST